MVLVIVHLVGVTTDRLITVHPFIMADTAIIPIIITAIILIARMSMVPTGAQSGSLLTRWHLQQRLSCTIICSSGIIRVCIINR